MTERHRLTPRLSILQKSSRCPWRLADVWIWVLSGFIQHLWRARSQTCCCNRQNGSPSVCKSKGKKEREKKNQSILPKKKKKKKLAWTAHGERVTTDGLIGTDRTCRGITVSSERSCSDSGRCRCADVTDRCLATVMLPVSSLPCPGKHGGERGGVGLFVDSLQFSSLSTQTRIPNWP